MTSVCLALPTNRVATAALDALLDEAAYAADRFDVAVHVLVLDSCGPDQVAAHAATLARPGRPSAVVVHHLDEDDQRRLLHRMIATAEIDEPDRVLAMLLPDAVSYGACTDRMFLFAAALGAASVHRRDSDSRYQHHDGAPVFPIHHELAALGARAASLADRVDVDALPAAHRDRAVALVGASFIGEPSVDLTEMAAQDPGVHRDVVALWAPTGATDTERDALVAESFRGAGTAPFTGDHTRLDLVDPMRIDMCNIALHSAVTDRVPLPTALDTIGSDYPLLHLVRAAGLPGVLHNRHIVNFHTPHRRTDAGFLAYQRRLVRFFLSMLYLHPVYTGWATAGTALLDGAGLLRAGAVATAVRDTLDVDPAENLTRLDVLDRSYRRLGGRYSTVAEHLATHRDAWLAQARTDMADWAWFIERWSALIAVSPHTPVPTATGRAA